MRSAWKYCFHSQREPLQPIKDPATSRRAPLVADLQWLQVLLTIHGRSPGSNWWRYVSTICLAICSGDIPLHWPYIGLIYGSYLHFRILKWPWSNHGLTMQTQASHIFHLKSVHKNPTKSGIRANIEKIHVFFLADWGDPLRFNPLRNPRWYHRWYHRWYSYHFLYEIWYHRWYHHNISFFHPMISFFIWSVMFTVHRMFTSLKLLDLKSEPSMPRHAEASRSFLYKDWSRAICGCEYIYVKYYMICYIFNF